MASARKNERLPREKEQCDRIEAAICVEYELRGPIRRPSSADYGWLRRLSQDGAAELIEPGRLCVPLRRGNAVAICLVLPYR